jgi:hypothetical protein
MGRHLPPDHSQGDANTIGGYRAVHDRPAAFEGRDGMSYSVELDTAETGERERPWAAYLLFVRWSHGDPMPTGHLETDFLVRAATEREALAQLGAMPLNEVRLLLDALIAERGEHASRPWWEAMHDEGGES